MDPAFPQLYEQPRHIQYATHFPIPQVSDVPAWHFKERKMTLYCCYDYDFSLQLVYTGDISGMITLTAQPSGIVCVIVRGCSWSAAVCVHGCRVSRAFFPLSGSVRFGMAQYVLYHKGALPLSSPGEKRGIFHLHKPEEISAHFIKCLKIQSLLKCM